MTTPGLIDWTRLPIGKHRLRCPACGRDDKPRDATLGVTLHNDHDGVAHCHRCDFRESFRGDPERDRRVRLGQIPPPKPAPVRHEQLSAEGAALWASASPLLDDDSPAARYLRSRRCVIPAPEAHLRWLLAHRHSSGRYTGPALVALATDALTAAPRSLHFTWLRHDGSGKAPINPPRLLLRGHAIKGAVIRLHAPGAQLDHLGVAEGLETALSLAHALPCVWACISAGGVKALAVVPGVRRLTVAADGDAPGRTAAEALADRYARAGVPTRIAYAPDGRDLNDLCAEDFQ